MKRSAIGLLAAILFAANLYAEPPSTGAASQPAGEPETIAVKRGTIDPSVDADGHFDRVDRECSSNDDDDEAR